MSVFKFIVCKQCDKIRFFLRTRISYTLIYRRLIMRKHKRTTKSIPQNTINNLETKTDLWWFFFIFLPISYLSLTYIRSEEDFFIKRRENNETEEKMLKLSSQTEHLSKSLNAQRRSLIKSGWVQPVLDAYRQMVHLSPDSIFLKLVPFLKFPTTSQLVLHNKPSGISG